MAILYKKLSVEEVLDAVIFATYYREIPSFEGKMKAELNEDGSVNVYAISEDWPEEEKVDKEELN